MTITTTLPAPEQLPPGEWARHPDSLQEEAYRDGWLQRLGGRPLYYLRYLTTDELAAWDAGYAAARRSLVCVFRADVVMQQHLVDDVLPAPAEPTVLETPAAVEIPSPAQPVSSAAGPEAPHFDGTQLCAQVDPELFFPEKGGSTAGAKKLCGTCEFVEPCLRYALDTRIGGNWITGVWGGTSERDRRQIRRGVLPAGLDVVDEDLVDDVDATGEVA